MSDLKYIIVTLLFWATFLALLHPEGELRKDGKLMKGFAALIFCIVFPGIFWYLRTIF